MAKELAKQYDPKGTEDRIYQEWCDKGYFHTQIDRSKKPFTIVMPPPNVTCLLYTSWQGGGALRRPTCQAGTAPGGTGLVRHGQR